jgi:hypothetical protein
VTAFDTPLTITGPYRRPRQLLAEQSIHGHTSIHDDATAAALELTGAPIEGPTHFSQFDPLAFGAWGPAWFERGCISSHFQTMVVAGERVQASMTTASASAALIEAHKHDGTPVLAGTASVGPDHPVSELQARRGRQGEPGELFIVDRLEVGMRLMDDEETAITFEERNGDMYPFSLAEKLDGITEPHPWYTPDGGPSSPWGRAIVPTEMISVLALKSGKGFPVRTPSLGLILDLEIRLLHGPILVGEPYALHHEVVGLGQSRRTESYWMETTITESRSGKAAATVLLHTGVFKESYPDYPKARLGA